MGGMLLIFLLQASLFVLVLGITSGREKDCTIKVTGVPKPFATSSYWFYNPSIVYDNSTGLFLASIRMSWLKGGENLCQGVKKRRVAWQACVKKEAALGHWRDGTLFGTLNPSTCILTIMSTQKQEKTRATEAEAAWKSQHHDTKMLRVAASTSSAILITSQLSHKMAYPTADGSQGMVHVQMLHVTSMPLFKSISSFSISKPPLARAVYFDPAPPISKAETSIGTGHATIRGQVFASYNLLHPLCSTAAAVADSNLPVPIGKLLESPLALVDGKHKDHAAPSPSHSSPSSSTTSASLVGRIVDKNWTPFFFSHNQESQKVASLLLWSYALNPTTGHTICAFADSTTNKLSNGRPLSDACAVCEKKYSSPPNPLMWQRHETKLLAQLSTTTSVQSSNKSNTKVKYHLNGVGAFFLSSEANTGFSQDCFIGIAHAIIDTVGQKG